MNVQLANVISDVAGETGQKILRAIVAGERDGQVLGAMKNSRIHASVDDIAKSLQGNWRAEHLLALKQALDAFDFIGNQVTECDAQVELQLQALQAFEGEPAKGRKRGRARNAPRFDLRAQLFKMCGVDLTRIDGIDVTTALAVISETGADMSRFPSDKHFASLSPTGIFRPLSFRHIPATALPSRASRARVNLGWIWQPWQGCGGGWSGRAWARGMTGRRA